jgi:beta-RFAP synthase
MSSHHSYEIELPQWQDLITVFGREPSGISVCTGSRIHFGLLEPHVPFGGIGMMIDRPQTAVQFVRGAPFALATSDPESDAATRINEIRERLIHHCRLTEPPRCSVNIVEQANPHSGLGSGTQLAMCVAEGLAIVAQQAISSSNLAHSIAGRGARSSVGLHGYFLGGFIYESRVQADAPFNQLIARVAVPDAWRVLLWRPRKGFCKVAGHLERANFSRLPVVSRREREALLSCIEERILPALQERRFIDFANGITDYNRMSGNLFAAVQGGAYNGPDIAECVGQLIGHGCKGVGQSSWGPTVFCLEPNASEAETTSQLNVSGWECYAVASPLNTGRSIQPMFTPS